MENTIQFLRDRSGKKVGVYLPIETWESLLKGELGILEKFKRSRKKKTVADLPSHDLGSDWMPSREELYDEHIFKKFEKEEDE